MDGEALLKVESILKKNFVSQQLQQLAPTIDKLTFQDI